MPRRAIAIVPPAGVHSLVPNLSASTEVHNGARGLEICLASLSPPAQHRGMKPLKIFILVALPLVSLHTSAQSQGELPDAEQPQLAEEGDWAADFNQLQIACYEGHMGACDSLWKSNRVLTDTFLYNYGRSCGGRVDRRQISRSGLDCTEAFPGH